MKKLITGIWMTILIIIYVMGVVSCKSHSPKEDEIEYGYKVLRIDSCQYIRKWAGPNSGYDFSHKGNCDNCRKHLDGLIKSKNDTAIH